jgi:predicted RNA-binding protein associated with RNAse of E/G family
VRAGDAHTIELFWDEGWGFLGWYINLQAPLLVQGNHFDTTDLELDIAVRPDGTWEWKDEDGFAEIQELGILDAAAAAEVRAEGERVIAERPWPTGWEDWRPPAEWKPLHLPEDWHVV